MTALVALRHYSLEEILTVKEADKAIGQTMKLTAGERMKVQDLLYGLLLESGNDAAYTLAENFPGGYSAFVSEMNRLAKKFHMENTQFRNVSGVEQVGHYTTVSDLARLAAIAMQHPVFSKIVSTKEKVVTNVENTTVYHLSNRNELLWEVGGIRGVKTGWTENAGECLVTDTLRNGNEIIVVVLKSSDRFGESNALIEWAYRAHNWVKPNI
jgi:D-alanyl-D-alanine carboxypeptidase (penicillin-binding protein 5/6)